MDINGLSGATGAAGATDCGLASLKSEDFFKILISELKQQDPLEPAKTADMISQVANIRDIELASTLNTSLTSLAATQQRSGFSDLIGKYIRAEVDLGEGQIASVEGVVSGIRFPAGGKPMLELDNGDAVPADSVTLVTGVDAAGDELLGAAVAGTGSGTGDDAAATKSAERGKSLPPWKRLLASLAG